MTPEHRFTDYQRQRITLWLVVFWFWAAAVVIVFGQNPPPLGPITTNDPLTNSSTTDMHLGEAWRINRDAANITLALIDNWFEPHPDLPNIHVITVEEGGTNEHGTTVLGTIAATHDNGIGLAGVMRHANILGVRGWNYWSIGKAVECAVTSGARIVYFPYGYPYERADWTNAFRMAFDSNVLVVCAHSQWAGQEYADYPALWQTKWTNIVSVGASIGTNFWRGISATHPQFCTIAAPGDTNWTTTTNGGYKQVLGTSQAAARVAGIAALLWSLHPDWTCFQVRERLMATADRFPDFVGKCASGRVNALAALSGSVPVRDSFELVVQQSPSVTGPWADIATNTVTNGGTGFFRVRIQ